MIQTHPCVYGPVISRRFGLSLGIDLLPFKSCCYDCAYCQIGPTRLYTMERQDFVALERVLHEVSTYLTFGPRPDVLSLSGCGEPTLYGSLGELIQRVREDTQVPVVLLTGGGLLHRPDVARDVIHADILAPSLDAGDEATFLRLNHPHPEISYSRTLSALRDVSYRFSGEIRIEVMLVKGINDSMESLAAIAAALGTIRHTSIDINTVVRPSRSGDVARCEPQTLELARELFGPSARIIAEEPAWSAVGTLGEGDPNRIVELVARRPCTIDEISRCLGGSSQATARALERLVCEGRIETFCRDEETFFEASRHHD